MLTPKRVDFDTCVFFLEKCECRFLEGFLIFGLPSLLQQLIKTDELGEPCGTLPWALSLAALEKFFSMAATVMI